MSEKTSSSKTIKKTKKESKNEECISISSSNNEMRKLKYSLLNKKRINNKKMTTMTTMKSVSRRGSVNNKIMILNFMYLSKTNPNYFKCKY